MIRLSNVSKSYANYKAVSSVSLHIQAGEIYGMIGASGAGKSTLLRLMNFLEQPTSGEIEVNGQRLASLSAAELRKARHSIGMIFQHFNLVANKTVFANVALPLELVGVARQQRKKRVMECLQFVGLEHLANQYPAQLSGGQKQRVAIARALANQPTVLLCDEPTSALDTTTTAEILSVLYKINQQLGVTIVIVSHELEVIKSICSKVSVIADGQVYQTLTIEPKGIQRQEKNPQRFVDTLLEQGGA